MSQDPSIENVKSEGGVPQSKFWALIKSLPSTKVRWVVWLFEFSHTIWMAVSRTRTRFPTFFGVCLGVVASIIVIALVSGIVLFGAPILSRYPIVTLVQSVNWTQPSGPITIVSVKEEKVPTPLRAYVVLHGGGGAPWVYEHTCLGYRNFRWEISTGMPYTVSVDALMLSFADHDFQILSRLNTSNPSVQAFSVPFCKDGARLYAVMHFSPINQRLPDFDNNPLSYLYSAALSAK